MIGQVVLLRLAEQYTLAAITAEHSVDDVDLRAFALWQDGHLGVVDIAHATRGEAVDQWTPPPQWPPPAPVAPVVPQLSEVKPTLMPAASMPPMPPMPMMVIIRY